MGNCVGAKSQSRYESRDKYNEQPTDTSTLDPLKYPLLNLKTLLTKLKLKRCSYYKFVGMRIEFGKYHCFDLKPKFIVNETAHWDVYHSFSFTATEYDLRKQFMQFTFVDDKNQVLGNLKINLYLLATGPYHQDFALDLQKGEGRISFNLKLCQEVELKLLVKEAQMIPSDKQFPGDIFSFNMKGLFGNRVQESQPSYKFLVSLNQKELGAQKQKVSSKRIERKQTLVDRPSMSEIPRLKKMASNMQNQQDPTLIKQGLSKKIKWSQAVSKDMPFIETAIPLFDVHGGSFIINFYSYCNKTTNLSSECFISYNKLYNQEFTLKRDQQKRKNYQVRKIEVVSKTWDHGKETGTAKFLLEFIIEQHLKQMQLCVRTEKGILESSPVVGDTGSSGKMPQELLQLQKLANEIQNQFIQISGSKDSKNYKWTAEINKRLLKQREILLISSKQSKLIFAYSDQNAVLKGQRALIQLGKKVKALLDEDNEEIGPNCWNLLISLVKRGEFNLAHMGFTHQQIQSYQSGNATQFIKRKKDVGLSYYQLLVQLLQRTFQSLQAYNYESQRQFAELFCAYAYFRLPKFRNEVLTVITRANDPEIQQWRGTQYSLNEQSNESKQEQGAYTLMFDWQNKFYKLLQTEQSFIKCDQKLKQLLRTSSWEERMKKRGGAFFAFVKYWANYVESIAINSKHISWRYFPGYTKILLSFMAEMKIRPISNYTEVMKKAAASMLTNDKLLNPFVLILFRKTNENDQPTVIKTFDLISLFFTSIKNRGRNLPSTFDLKLLSKAIKSILQGDASYAIGKVLLLIYDHFKLFPLDFRLEITNYLMTKAFFKLFLHWSHNVRTIFHHLFFIRVYHQASKPLDQHDYWDQEVLRNNPQYRTETISRYRKLMLILQNTQHFEHKIRTNKIDLYEKQTYKKLRKKVQEKRKGVSNPDNSIKKKFSDETEYRKQLMFELGQPKLQSYASQVFAKNLVVVMEKKMLTPAKEEVIVRNLNSRTSDVSTEKTINRRKRSITINNFQDELVPLKDEEIPYTRRALQQYGKISELFISHMQKNKDTIPVVRLELSLDEKELRPDGLAEHQQW